MCSNLPLWIGEGTDKCHLQLSVGLCDASDAGRHMQVTVMVSDRQGSNVFITRGHYP